MRAKHCSNFVLQCLVLMGEQAKRKNFWGKTKLFLKSKVPFWIAIVFLLAAAAFLLFSIKKTYQQIQSDYKIKNLQIHKIPERHEHKEKFPKPKEVFIPRNFSMSTLETRGCVADGILSGYGSKTSEAINLINRSACLYLHRALETWGSTPDFDGAAENIVKFKKPGMVFGMFLAEAVRDAGTYTEPGTGKKFYFDKMCQPGTDEKWGWHTCLADFNSKEYRRYIESITHRAMDLGIQSFTFGQIYLQDGEPFGASKVPGVIKNMRDYAKSKHLQIVIGAQTNAITDSRYLGMFDYIEGGAGIDQQGKIENGPCWSRKESCWALLWNKEFSAKAKNVLLDLDWSGIQDDDMSTFARMAQAERGTELKYLYNFFTSRNMGFLMPMLAPLYPDNGGCYGPSKHFYSPDDKYKCKDEDMINDIFSG